MQDVTDARSASNLPLTRNHLYALGALSLSLAVLAFFVGYSLGLGQVAPAAPPAQVRFVPEEVRTGDLEVLLAKVEHASAGDPTLGFPSELSRSDPPPGSPDAEAALVVERAPFPAEPRPGSAQVEPLATPTEPMVGEDVPTGGWAVQVAEHEVETDAGRYVETLRAAGLPAYTAVALVAGKTVWRVRVGGYRTKDAAAAALPAISSKSGASSATVTPAP